MPISRFVGPYGRGKGRRERRGQQKRWNVDPTDNLCFTVEMLDRMNDYTPKRRTENKIDGLIFKITID